MDIDKQEIINYFNNNASTWDVENADVEGAKNILSIPLIKEAIFGAKVLDVGCGTGVLEPLLVAGGAKYVKAIDISLGMIDIANLKVANGQIDREKVDFCVEDVYQQKEKFDLVIMYNVYPHLPDKEKFAQMLPRILNENGKLVIAHGRGRSAINAHHDQHAANISNKLKSANEEAKIFHNDLIVDLIIDEANLYCICLQLIS